ncbi:uncharacterized protein PEZ65_018884 [Lycodopsis pacificus]
MTKVQMLRCLVNQRLTAAAEEIFGVFERTIAEYEEQLSRSQEQNERQRKLLDAVFIPQLQLHRADVQQLLVVKEEQQEWSSSLDQEDPEPPHIKEEQEELWTSQEGEQLQGLEEADIKFSFSPVKSEDDEEEAQSSQLHQRQTEQMETEADGEDCGGPEPDRNSDPDTYETSLSYEPETDDGRDWEEMKEPQSDLNLLQNNEVSVSDLDCNTGKTSIRNGHVKKRTAIHTGVNLFSCSICGKRFSQEKSFTTHLGLHTEGKLFSCSVCRRLFSTSGFLVKHMRIHSREKPFSCSICNKRFTHRCDLRRHLVVHTGEKPFSCSVCSKRFTQSGHLRRHSVVHTGEKQFSCSFCSKAFTQKGDLRQHLTLHTGVKAFSCCVCDQRFARLDLVKKHKCVGLSNRNAWSSSDAC